MGELPGKILDMLEQFLYEIRIKGQLKKNWSDWFDGMALIHDTNGEMLLRGPVADQAALHGLLAKVRDLGLTLIAVNLIPDPEEETHVQK